MIVDGVVRTVACEFSDGGRFEARPDTIGTDSDELRLLASMSDAQRFQRVAALQENVMHAYETLRTAEPMGRA